MKKHAKKTAKGAFVNPKRRVADAKSNVLRSVNQLTMPNQIFTVAPKPPKGAKKRTKDKGHATTDGYDNFLSRIGLNNDNTLSAGVYEFNLMTRNRIQLEAAYRGSWIVGQVIDSIPEDMTRAGIDVTTNEADEDIQDFQSAMVKLQIWQSLCDLEKWARLYGGAIGVLQIEGQELSSPLNLESVGKDQFKGIVVYDRWQLNPELQNVIQSGPEMGLPKYYNIVTTAASAEPDAFGGNNGQIRVHHSRCVRSIGIKLPFFQAITEMMWGESVLERLWDRLIAFDNATMSSASLIDRANLRTVQIDGLREIIAAGGKAQAGLEAQFEMMRMMQVNEGLTLLDKEDLFAATPYTFAGLSDMLLQFGQQLSGASQIPLVRLFGQSPAGLSATGDSDIRMYYDNINAQQEAKYRRPLDIITRVMWRSVFGKPAPKDLEFSFTPLWQMSTLDKATIAKTSAETIIGAHEAGLTDRATAMKELRDSSSDTGIFSNISDEAIEEAEEEEPPMPEAAGLLVEEDKSEEPKAPVKNLDAAFREDDHPRRKDGKFGEGGGSEAKGKKPEEKSDDPFDVHLSEEQAGIARARFREIEEEKQGKRENPATETPEQNSERRHDLEKATRLRSEIKMYAKEDSITAKLGSDGFVSATVKGNTATIQAADLKQELRGLGLGLTMYEQVIEAASKRGLKVTSDLTVEGPALRVYEALAKRGYDVVKNPKAKEGELSDGSTFLYVPGLKQPVFTVAKKKTQDAAHSFGGNLNAFSRGLDWLKGI